MIKTLKVRYKGTKPLIMHCGLGASPLDSRKLPEHLKTEEHSLLRTYKKALASKRGKTERDLEKLSELDFLSSLYLNDKGKIIIPSENIEASLIGQAKEIKVGRASLATTVKRAVTIPEDSLLDFPGKDKSLKELYESHKYQTVVKVSMSKTLSTRAIFQKWSFETTIEYMPSLLDKQQILDILDLGKYHGFMGRRPKFGRYSYEVIK